MAGGNVGRLAIPSRTANERLKEAVSAGFTALVTAFPRCERHSKDAVRQYGGNIEIYDIAEIVHKALEPGLSGSAPVLIGTPLRICCLFD